MYSTGGGSIMLQEFVKQIREEIDSRTADIHTSIPAKIISYDQSTSHVTVKPYGVVVSGKKSVEYPMISGVPVIMPMSAVNSCGIATPVTPGDDCLLIISEQDISCWLDGSVQNIELTHDLSNAVAICGLSNKVNSFANQSTQNGIVKIYNGSTTIDVSKDCVVIKQGSSEVCVSNGTVTVKGNLSVTGNITYGGTCQKG